jgi:hypothetical protein
VRPGVRWDAHREANEVHANEATSTRKEPT